MIKMRLKTEPDETPIIVLGISDHNIKALKDGRPIKILHADLKLPGLLSLVFYGRDEKAINNKVRAFFRGGPDFGVHIFGITQQTLASLRQGNISDTTITLLQTPVRVLLVAGPTEADILNRIHIYEPRALH